MDAVSGEALVFHPLNLSDVKRLKAFYEAYVTSFPHEDEREDFASTVWLMNVNDLKPLQEQFGPYREIAIAICLASTNEVVGGLWFGIVSSPEHLAAGFAASIQAIYLFVYKAWRDLLKPSAVLNELRRSALAAFPPPAGSGTNAVAIFFEANNPLRMSAEEIEEDFDNSETDTYRRFGGWLYYARPLDFEYVQPPLDPSKQPVHFLTLFYKGPGRAVSTAMLLSHLRIFFSISVLKGHDARVNPHFQTIAAALGSKETISFVARDNPDIQEIRDIADWRSHVAHKQSDPFESLHAPPFPEGRRRLLPFTPRLCNAGYRLIYRMYHWLERYHMLVTTLESILGIVAFAASALVAAHVIEKIFGGVLIPSLAEWLEKFAGRIGLEHYDHYILLFLSLYIGTRGIVHLRRNQLGHRFGALRRRVSRMDDGSVDSVMRVTAWLKDELGRRASGRQAFGPMIRKDTPETDRSRVQVLIASLSAQIYSDQVWRVVDYEWQQWENRALSDWLYRFSGGLVGATYASCPGRTFFSLILPVVTPPRLTRLDLRNLQIDDRYARRLMGSSNVPVPAADPAQGPPTLLVARLLMTGRAAGARRSSALEAQLALILTGLLHIGLLLRRLANAGDVVSGLPRNTTILVVAANRQSADVLLWFGFQVLQRAAPHEEESNPESPGEANLSLYRLVIASPAERTTAEHRFLDIINHLLTTIVA